MEDIMRRKLVLICIAVLTITLFFSIPQKAQAVLDAVTLQLHNPLGSAPTAVEPGNTKTQFLMSSNSDPGVKITQITWNFVSSVFFDTTNVSPGWGGYRDFSVYPSAETKTADSTSITIGLNSDLTTGYTGPTSITNGNNSIILTFNDFDSGEAFGFWSDLDSTADNTGHLRSDLWNGSYTDIYFDNGGFLRHTWNISGNGVSRGAYTKTPEPATMALLGLGLIGAFKRLKRKA